MRRATGGKNLPFSKHALNTLNFEDNHVNRKDFHFQLLSCRRYAMNILRGTQRPFSVKYLLEEANIA